jgi:hypothetical protein
MQMVETTERYLVDEQGVRIGVLLDIAVYQKLLDAFEELECLRAYDEAKASGGDLIPLEEAIRQIESRRQ